MAIEIYGVTRDTVLDYIKAWAPAGSVLPGYETIATTGTHVLGAATEIAGSLAKGGYGHAAGNNSTTYPYAYQALTDLISKLAALRFAEPLKILDEQVITRGYAQVRAEQAQIEAGGTYHELEVTTSKAAGRFYRGDSTSDTHDARRFSADDEL